MGESRPSRPEGWTYPSVTAGLVAPGPGAKRDSSLPRFADIAAAELAQLRATTPIKPAKVPRLAEFIRRAWPVLEPGTKLQWNWHLDAIAEHLEAVTRGEIRKLVINIPPSHMKTLAVCVCWPAWVWAQKPEWRGIFGSYSGDLSIDSSVKCRSLIESDWYAGRFRRGWALSTDQNVKGHFENTRRGLRVAVSVTGKTTGFHGDAVVVDDPLGLMAAFSKAKREQAVNWLDKSLGTRLSDPKTGVRVIIMQRLHEDDPTGHVLRQGGYEHLCFPSEFEPQRRSRTFVTVRVVDQSPSEEKPATPPGASEESADAEVYREERRLFFEDPRTQPGELLFPARFDKRVLDDAKLTLQGAGGYAGQHQQRPAPESGLMFNGEWWRFWRYPWEPEHSELEERTIVLSVEDIEAMEQVQSWDCSFKKTEGSDLVAGGVWARRGAWCVLLALTWRRMTFRETVVAIRELSGEWPLATVKLIEDTANGPAIIDTLRDELSGIIPITPAEHGSKLARATATVGRVEAGNVFLPVHAPFVSDYIEQHKSFPMGSHDDAVDQQSQVLLRWRPTQEPYLLGGDET